MRAGVCTTQDGPGHLGSCEEALPAPASRLQHDIYGRALETPPQASQASPVGGVKAKLLCSSEWRIATFAGVLRAYWSGCWTLHWWQTALMTWLQAIHYRAGNFSHVNVNEDTESSRQTNTAIYCMQTSPF